MKTSRAWLQTFFDAPLPDAQTLADALTFHAFEIESVAGDILDVKVTANRGHDCLSHRGIAQELSAILQLPLNKERDPFARTPNLSKKSDAVEVSIEDPILCKRYIAGYIRGVQVAPSPEWLRSALEAIGQRSINNIVDATNYVMWQIGQPLHAFDAGKLEVQDGTYSIAVRGAREGETLVALDGTEYALKPSMLLITDANRRRAPSAAAEGALLRGEAIGIAGVKGGQAASISEATTDIILESANFDGPTTRKTAAMLKLRTDASAHFEQVLSPELAAYGMQQVVDIITTMAGGTVEGFVDVYPVRQEQRVVSVSLEKINAVLGTHLAEADVADAFARLALPFEQGSDEFVVTPPLERLDLTIPEDLIEEVARIIGYDKVPAAELPPFARTAEVNASFASAEEKREELMAQGYSEVFTSAFAEKGERVVANKVDGVRPYLRANLTDGLRDAYERNMRIKELLGLTEVKLFEIGVVWKGGKEVWMVGTADKRGVREESLAVSAKDSPAELPISRAQKYTPFSKYPFIARDIAMWIPESTTAFSDAVAVFAEYNKGLLRHVDLFDQYKKDARVSYAFHLVFQSFEKTLTDEEVNAIMSEIYTAVKEKGWEVR